MTIDVEGLKDIFKRSQRRTWSVDGHAQEYSEPQVEVPWTPLDADAWQKFKRDFVKEYGGETVKPTGMTNSELLDYIATGVREGDALEDEFLVW